MLPDVAPCTGTPTLPDLYTKPIDAMNPHPRRPAALIAAFAIALPFVAAELDAQTVIAHRGASAHLPEHTFAAWDRAIELGADYIEQDLQMTSDGVLVVLHDGTLNRTARGSADDCTGPVSEKTLAQLRRCEVSSWKVDALRAAGETSRATELAGLPPQRIPTLEEVFDRYGSDGSVRYYIETKSPEDAPGMEVELLRVLRESGLDGTAWSNRVVIVQSFSAQSLRLLSEIAPDLPLVQLGDAGLDDGGAAGVSGDGSVGAAMRRIADYAVGWGPPHRMLSPELLGAAHAEELVVHPYTVNDPDRMLELLGMGVDGMFTDVPGQLLELLGR